VYSLIQTELMTLLHTALVQALWLPDLLSLLLRQSEALRANWAGTTSVSFVGL
jgi:hypothetical protein